MRFVKSLLLVLGAILILGAVGLGIWDIIQINQLTAVASANRSSGFANPRNWVLLMAAAALVGGLLAGLGLGMPSETFKARYSARKKQDDVAAANRDGFSGASSGTREQR